MKYGFGVDLGGTTVKIAYFDENGTMLNKWEIPTVTAGGGTQILPDIAASIKGYMAEHDVDPSSIVGIGIGVPGPVDGKGVVNRGYEATEVTLTATVSKGEASSCRRRRKRFCRRLQTRGMILYDQSS